MSKASELRNKFKRDLRDLQNTCPHIESAWMQHMWAPGHISPGKVKVCSECEKILNTVITEEEREK
jgi:hypothetical protein